MLPRIELLRHALTPSSVPVGLFILSYALTGLMLLLAEGGKEYLYPPFDEIVGNAVELARNCFCL